MKYKLEMVLDNAAFRNDDGSINAGEIARVLRGEADELERSDLNCGDLGVLHDINGNRVGTVKVIR